MLLLLCIKYLNQSYYILGIFHPVSTFINNLKILKTKI